MSQNGQPHFKNLAVFVARLFFKVSDHFGTLCIKGFKTSLEFRNQTHCFNYSKLEAVPNRWVRLLMWQIESLSWTHLLIWVTHLIRYQNSESSPKALLKPSQRFTSEFFSKTVYGFQSLTIFAKSSIVDVRLGSEYASKLLSQFYHGFSLVTYLLESKDFLLYIFDHNYGQKEPGSLGYSQKGCWGFRGSR